MDQDMNGSLNFSLNELPGSLLPDPGDIMMGQNLSNDTETQDAKFTSTNNLRIVSLAGKKMFLELHLMYRLRLATLH